MAELNIKPASDCKYDIVSLGEVMARLDPGEMRIRDASTFSIWEGGGEYNVARGGARVFGLRTAIVTAFPDNEIARLLQARIRAGGVDDQYIKWVPFDGVGRSVRVGLNWTERGFGTRAALGIYDRGHSAAAQLKSGDIDWEKIFGQDGVRWFHCGGIYAALSETTPDVIIEAMDTARKYGTIVSYDFNFRPSLFKANGNLDKAKDINCNIAKHVDVMFGSEHDFHVALGMQFDDLELNPKKFCTGNFQKATAEVLKEYPSLKAIATTLRSVQSASSNDWSAVMYYRGDFHHAQLRERVEILDRVGAGDSFASGVIYGFLQSYSAAEVVEYGVAHGALAMTTPGDNSMALLADVERLVRGDSSGISR